MVNRITDCCQSISNFSPVKILPTLLRKKFVATGIEMSVGDVDSGIVKVIGKVNPTEVCDWLKRETRKNVKVVCPYPPVENVKQVPLV